MTRHSFISLFLIAALAVVLINIVVDEKKSIEQISEQTNAIIAS